MRRTWVIALLVAVAFAAGVGGTLLFVDSHRTKVAGPDLHGNKTFCTLLANVDLDKNLAQLATTPPPDAGTRDLAVSIWRTTAKTEIPAPVSDATDTYADGVAQVLAHRSPRPELADAIATMESYARHNC